MEFLNFFLLVLLFIWQVSSGKYTGGWKNANSKRYSSKSDDDSDHQQKLIKESKTSNIVPDKSFESRHSSSDAKNDHISKLRRLKLQKNTSPSSELPARDKSNVTKPKLEPGDTDIKTATPIGIEPPIYSEENNESEENALITFLKTSALNPPIQNVFFKYITDIYTYDCESKTLMINCASRSAEISMLLYDIRHGFSDEIVKTVVLKNLVIGYATFKTVAYFSYRCQNIFNTLIIDSCLFSPFPSIEFIPKSLPNIKKLKINNCTCISTFGSFLDCFKDDLEEFVIETCHFSSQFNVPSNLTLKNLQCARLIRCSLNASILTNILTLFPVSFHSLDQRKQFIALHTLELSHLCMNGENNNYVFFGDYLTLDFIDLNVHNRFSHLKNLAVKENKIINFLFENFSNLEEFEYSTYINSEIIHNLNSELGKMKNLKRIKIDGYYFRNFLDSFTGRNIIFSNNFPLIIFRGILSNISSILSTFTNVYFDFTEFTADNLKSIRSENENNNFEHLESVTFSNFNSTDNIVFMNRFINYFHGIRRITFHPKFENITENQIESFNEIKTYDKIENVHFELDSCSDISVTCEFMIQILKQVPNLKSLYFKSMKEDIINSLFNLLQENDWEFPNLKKIYIESYFGSIDLLLWFIKTSVIEELYITISTLLLSSNESLNSFSSKTLRKLNICGTTTENDGVFLKKCFSNMESLKELHLLSNNIPIKLFENNSKIEKVTFEYEGFNDVKFEDIFTVLKNSKSLEYFCVKFRKDHQSSVTSSFKEHFEGRNVKLIFYSRFGYFQ